MFFIYITKYPLPVPPSLPSSAVVKKELTYTSTPLWPVWSVQSLSACTSVHFAFTIFIFKTRYWIEPKTDYS
jgi:hypothetical protein